MRRKDFLKSGLLFSLGGLLLFRETGCKGSTTPSNPSTTDSKTYTSSTEEGHSHTVAILIAEIQNPPSGGISKQTSASSGHTHTFRMTQDQLSSVNGGSSLMIPTSTDVGHSHTFVIQK